MISLLPILASGSGTAHSFILNHTLELGGTIIFALAVLHTFSVKNFTKISKKFRHRSIMHNIFHLLGEIEIVFGFWAFIFIAFMHIQSGRENVLAYLETQVNYTEAAFVFCVMCMAASAPVIHFAETLIKKIASLLPTSANRSFFLTVLIFGPILGSFITEPAAMTVTALLLRKNLMKGDLTHKFRYAILGLLFVNISIGGTLSNFAAPPVLMVATPWEWSMPYMFLNFGWKAVIAIIINTSIVMFFFRHELDDCPVGSQEEGHKELPSRPTRLVTMTHIILLTAVIINSHHIIVFVGIFLLFLGWCEASNEFQSELNLQESLLVGFFLAGLVTLGPMQAWWLKPILEKLDSLPLFIGTTALTGVTDNAALTYLGTLVDLTETQKYSLVAGAVAGGGLSVIANAPNPAGFGILKERFGRNGISPFRLLQSALGPTLVAMLCFELLPNLHTEKKITIPYTDNMKELLNSEEARVVITMTSENTIIIGSATFEVEEEKRWQSWLETYIPLFCEKFKERRKITFTSQDDNASGNLQNVISHIREVEKNINKQRKKTALAQKRNFKPLTPANITITGKFGIINQLGRFKININGSIDVLEDIETPGVNH